jgi:hypothetical protein
VSSQIEKQYFTHRPNESAKSLDVYSYFENAYGDVLDANGDGAWDGYLYNSSSYAVFATANLLVGFLLPNVSAPYTLRNLFQVHRVVGRNCTAI